MSTLLILTVFAIASSAAPGTGRAAPHAPARLQPQDRVGPVALAQPRPARAETAPARCPYHFDSDMPAGTFCVYQGIAFDAGDQVCAADIVAIWSSTVEPPGPRHAPANPASGSPREVYLAFVADPQLVLQASVDSQQSDRAEVVGYTAGSDDAPQPLAGQMTLGSSETADVLRMDLRVPRRWRPGNCAVASYSGLFMGIIRTPSADAAGDTLMMPPD